tara:strand:- start:2444 stop:3214 length:771 start_codon:yes stop_codon:yes gene_type:complete
VTLLRTCNLDILVTQRKLIHQLELEIDSGTSWALLGRNGTGKTSLLHTLAKLKPAAAGEIFLKGDSLAELSGKSLARRIGLLFQQGLPVMPKTVSEAAMLGRYPHHQSLWRDDPEDITVVEDALRDFDLTHLSARSIQTLSGGEAQRLALAQLVAQAPSLYLLDEPSNHLDLAHQLRGLRRLKSKVTSQRAALMMASHDINLISQICDHVLLLMGDGTYLAGPVDKILQEDNLSEAFECRIRRVESGEEAFFFPLA